MLKFTVFIFYWASLVSAFFEGDVCYKNGVKGTCRLLQKCPSAVQDLYHLIEPKICSIYKKGHIVCCLEDNSTIDGDRVHRGPPTKPAYTTSSTPATVVTTPSQRPVTTTKRSTSSTTEYIPEEEVFIVPYVPEHNVCKPIDPSLTSPKTGQRAWDKCIEYQEQLVYPCVNVSSVVESGVKRMNRCHHKADELISGGTAAMKNEFPHMAGLGYGDVDNLQWLCGGSLISDRFILTAAHCARQLILGPVTYVKLGALNLDNDEGFLYKIKQVHRHPRYDPPIVYNDIALLETEKPVQLSHQIVPACVHTGHPVLDEAVLTIGWGQTAHRGVKSDGLLKVILTKFSDEECGAQYKPLPEGYRHLYRGFDSRLQLCYGDKDLWLAFRTGVSKDTCEGDSGGPVQIKSKSIHCMYTVIGVTSSGRGCGEVGQAGLYTKVSYYLDWIEDTVWPRKQDREYQRRFQKEFFVDNV